LRWKRHRRRYLPQVAGHYSNADQQYLQREWTEMISGVFASMDHAWFVNDPQRQNSAVKPLQLRLAEQLGLRIPDTLITNDPVAAATFIDRHERRVVHKTLTAPRHRFLPTKAWSESDRDVLDQLVIAPTIFQEMVTNCLELRITVVGEQVFAAAFRPAAGLIDGRLDVGTPYCAHALPYELSRRLLALVRQLGLVFSTIDMKLTDDGEYVFLELNPMGQYLYIEILAGLPLTAAIAELLVLGRGAVQEPGQTPEALVSARTPAGTKC
jgi:glutathione synthase/RimK-type ligase-like ATP-grasp enzyme